MQRVQENILLIPGMISDFGESHDWKLLFAKFFHTVGLTSQLVKTLGKGNRNIYTIDISYCGRCGRGTQCLVMSGSITRLIALLSTASTRARESGATASQT